MSKAIVCLPDRVPASLLRAYRATIYEAAGIAVRIGRRSPSLDRLLVAERARSAVLLTAWNPYSHRMPEGWNRRMQHALAARLRRWVVRPACGRGRGWAEAHVLAFAPEAPACRIAWRFRQRAVVVVRRGQAARLRFNPG